MDNAASINVAVRIRPPTEWETARLPNPLDSTRQFFGDGHLTASSKVSSFGRFRNIIAYEEDGSLIYDPMDPQVEAQYRAKGYLPPGTYRYKHRKYQYDHVFGPNIQQQEVFERTTKPLLDGILDGYNGTVFAYGATGCGKTHTISGTPEDPGIIYATMAELFLRIDERKDDYIVDVSLSFLEIYNEEIRDLLSPAGTVPPRGGLAIREDSSNRVTVAGLTELVPTSAEEVNAIVQAGNARRTQSPTHANATSSRSHAVLQVNVTQSPRTPDVSEERTMATLSIIDLAGSERASATKNMGKRMIEGANINKSLLALGNCINALCETRTRAHIPYRNSKLTRLLKFSLGGNCKTVMIVCVAPTSQHLEDTGNTLAYANRAKEIKTKVSKNIMDVDRHVGQYVQAINRLNDEVRELKAKLAGEIALDNEATKRRRANATRAVEAAREEIRALATKSKTMLCMGSFTAGNTAASHAKLEVIRSRLREVEAQGELTSELEAEKALLSTLVTAEEGTIAKDADAISRASSTAALFTTNVGLAQKRKGNEDWDEYAPQLLKMEGDVVLAEMRAAQAEHERDGLRQALNGQAKMVATLVGMLARTNALVGDGARMLSTLAENGMTPDQVAEKLQALVEINQKTFTDVIGVSTKSAAPSGKTSFATLSAPPLASSSKKRSSGSGVGLVLKPRVSSGGRRASMNGLGSPGRRPHGYRSPRKQSSMRQNGGGASRRAAAEKKSVRWAIPINPEDPVAEPVTPTRKPSPLPTTKEQDWEDDRTDESTTSGMGSVSGSSTISLDAAALSWGASNAASTSSDAGSVNSLGARTVQAKPALSSLQEEGEPAPRRTILGDHNLPASASKSRRRSHIGPMRSDRTRRRSSLIPQLSPAEKSFSKTSDVSGRKSPKKTKRNSLLGALTSGRMIRPSLLKIGVETSGSKPSWK